MQLVGNSDCGATSIVHSGKKMSSFAGVNSSVSSENVRRLGELAP